MCPIVRTSTGTAACAQSLRNAGIVLPQRSVSRAVLRVLPHPMTPVLQAAGDGRLFSAHVCSLFYSFFVFLVTQICAAPSCSQHDGDCAGCTQQEGCGYCATEAVCVDGTINGPTNGSCDVNSWAFQADNCTSKTFQSNYARFYSFLFTSYFELLLYLRLYLFPLCVGPRLRFLCG